MPVTVGMAVSVGARDRTRMPVPVHGRPAGAVGHHLFARKPQDPARRECVPMRGDDHRRSLRRRVLEQPGDDGRVLLVHRVQRLVREQDAGSGRQGARDCDSLALAGRQLVGIRPPPVRELDRFQRFDRALLDRSVRHLRVAQLQCEDYVFEGVQAGQQSLLLEDERDLAAQAAQATPPPAVQPAPTDPELAVVRAELAVDQAQQGRLARPARACDLDQLALPDREVDRLEHGVAAIRLRNADELDRRLSYELAVCPRALPGRSDLLRSHRLRAVAVLVRASAASSGWSASHPLIQISPCRVTGPT